MLKMLTPFIVLLVSSSTVYSQRAYVPDSSTAIKIAEAIWLPIYGEHVYKQKPFTAHLVGDSIWVVQGSIHGPKNGFDTSSSGVVTFTVSYGGVLNAEIRKNDCKVISVFRSK
jgi:hypothetical protein